MTLLSTQRITPGGLVRYRPELEKYFHRNPNRYWCIEVVNAQDVLRIIDYVPATILSEIKHSDLYLIINNQAEGFVSILDPIYDDLIIKHEIPEHKIILVTASYDIKESIDAIASTKNKKIISHVVWSVVEKALSSAISLGRIVSDIPNPKKKYICLNRRWRLHRPALVGLLASRNLLHSGYVSLTKSDDGKNWNTVYDSILATHTHMPCQETLEILTQNRANILSLPNLWVDTENTMLNPIWDWNETSHWYKDSVFSVVTETNFYQTDRDSTRFITEKTFKSVANCSPFILVSVPNSLAVLKNLGYQTFSPWINESYDHESNDNKRLLMIVHEIERLCNLPEDQLRKFRSEIEHICKHNFNILLSKKYPEDFIWDQRIADHHSIEGPPTQWSTVDLLSDTLCLTS